MPRAVVLAYHGVGEVTEAEDPGRLVVSPRHLEDHVRLLLRRGYRFVTAETLLEEWGGDAPPPGTAVLTFDDGFESWRTVAAPLLTGLGIPATFFICPGWFGQQHPGVPGAAGRLLDADGVLALASAGMDIGSHTMTHADLRGLDPAALRHELEASKAAVEDLLGRPCRTFAYPYGLHDPPAVDAVAEAGYELAFEWLPGPWRALRAPRLPGPPRHGAGRLFLKLAGVRRPGR